MQRKILLTVLYIPHGSDERMNCRDKNGNLYIFISHMVQMKACFFCFAAENGKSFISHMVQMKAKKGYPGVKKSLSFISHMVQMKAYWYCSWTYD